MRKTAAVWLFAVRPSSWEAASSITMRVFFFSVAAAALMERLPLAASYVMVTVTMVARASWTQRQMYLCVCEYFIMLWAFYDMTLDVHGISALLFSVLGVTF